METREKGKYDFSLDNRQVGLIVSGLILVLALSFLLGTLFGRNLGKMADTGSPAAVAMADASTAEATDLAAMPAEGATAPAAGGTVAPATLAGGTSDRDSLIAGLQAQKPSLDPTAAAPVPGATAPAAAGAAYQPPAANAPVPLSAPIPTAPAAPKPALAPTAPAATAAAPLPAPKPQKPATDPAAASPAAQPAGNYTIQIASAPSKAEGQTLVNELRSKKYDAYMLPVALPTGTFYRVRVGHYSSLDQAEKARKILQTREGKYFDAWITQ